MPRDRPGRGGPLQGAERGFAVIDEDVADRLARRFLDGGIGVEEADAQQPGHQRAHGGLARPGRADEDRHRPGHAITSESR